MSLERLGQGVRMTPVVPELREAFYTARIYGGQSGDWFRVARCRAPLVANTSYLGDDCQEFNAGLQPLVVEWLKAKGYRVQVTGTPPKLRPPSEKGLRQFSERDVGVLNFIREHDRGIIRYAPREVSLANLFAQVAAAWPRKRILVLATRTDDVQRLGHQLAQTNRAVTIHYRGHSPEKAGRVAISTYLSSSEGAVEREKREILIAIDPAELIRRLDGCRALQDSWRARVYGLLPIGTQFAPYDQDRLLSVFGPEQLFVQGHGSAGLGWRVLFERFGKGVEVPKDLTHTQQKRRLIWNNAPRNRWIARLAGCLGDWNEAVLQTEFPSVFHAVSRRFPPRVAVLVENVEHAVALADSLHWPIVAGAAVCRAGLRGKQTGWLNRSRRLSQSVIVTHGVDKSVGRFQALVRADGGTGIPECLNILCAEKMSLMVDLDDRFHPLVRRNVILRTAAYLRAGHRLLHPGEGEIGLLQRFLDSRPEVDLG